MIPPVKTHSGLKLILTNPFGQVKNKALAAWYEARFGHSIHKGVDLILDGSPIQNFGTELVSCVDGYVPFIRFDDPMSERGNFIFIQSDTRKYELRYFHISKSFVKSGDNVKVGQVIGLMGNSGTVSPKPTEKAPANGSHIHFELHKNKGGSFVPVDPMDYIKLDEALAGEDTGGVADLPTIKWSLDRIAEKVKKIIERLNFLKRK